MHIENYYFDRKQIPALHGSQVVGISGDLLRYGSFDLRSLHAQEVSRLLIIRCPVNILVDSTLRHLCANREAGTDVYDLCAGALLGSAASGHVRPCIY